MLAQRVVQSLHLQTGYLGQGLGHQDRASIQSSAAAHHRVEAGQVPGRGDAPSGGLHRLMHLGAVVGRDHPRSVAVLHGVQRGHPLLVLLVQAHVGVGHTQGTGYLLTEEAVEGPAVNAADQLADHPAVVAGMIGHHLAWGILRSNVLHGLHHRVPIPPLAPV